MVGSNDIRETCELVYVLFLVFELWCTVLKRYDLSLGQIFDVVN